MTLLGENISELRRATALKRLSLRTVVLLGVQMVDAIRQLHEAGFIHRDIKPSNVCVGLQDARQCYLLDFGLVSICSTRACPLPRAPRRATSRLGTPCC